MKVIQTRVTKKHKATQSSIDDFSEVARDYPLTEDDGNEEVAMTKEGFVAILESSGIIGYILETLKERYLLRYSAYGEAEGVVESWLVENRDSFTAESIDLLLNRTEVDVIAQTILDNHIDPHRIRAGELSRSYVLPLIGESKYVKH